MEACFPAGNFFAAQQGCRIMSRQRFVRPQAIFVRGLHVIRVFALNHDRDVYWTLAWFFAPPPILRSISLCSHPHEPQYQQDGRNKRAPRSRRERVHLRRQLRPPATAPVQRQVRQMERVLRRRCLLPRKYVNDARVKRQLRC